jgi:hypothetical protein
MCSCFETYDGARIYGLKALKSAVQVTTAPFPCFIPSSTSSVRIAMLKTTAYDMRVHGESKQR